VLSPPPHFNIILYENDGFGKGETLNTFWTIKDIVSKYNFIDGPSVCLSLHASQREVSPKEHANVSFATALCGSLLIARPVIFIVITFL